MIEYHCQGDGDAGRPSYSLSAVCAKAIKKNKKIIENPLTTNIKYAIIIPEAMEKNIWGGSVRKIEGRLRRKSPSRRSRQRGSIPLASTTKKIFLKTIDK